jgi:hypothetical protein
MDSQLTGFLKASPLMLGKKTVPKTGSLDAAASNEENGTQS